MKLSGQDGEDYINIYSKAQTPLGRGLSNWDQCNIRISIGYFKTIEGLIFYLGSFDESFRKFSGYEAKFAGDKLDRGIRLPEDIFRGFIFDAMCAKIDKDSSLRNLLIESGDLPLVHYYNYNDNKIFVPKWDWQVEKWTSIRQTLQEEANE